MDNETHRPLMKFKRSISNLTKTCDKITLGVIICQAIELACSMEVALYASCLSIYNNDIAHDDLPKVERFAINHITSSIIAIVSGIMCLAALINLSLLTYDIKKLENIAETYQFETYSKRYYEKIAWFISIASITTYFYSVFNFNLILKENTDDSHTTIEKLFCNDKASYSSAAASAIILISCFVQYMARKNIQDQYAIQRSYFHNLAITETTSNQDGFIDPGIPESNN